MAGPTRWLAVALLVLGGAVTTGCIAVAAGAAAGAGIAYANGNAEALIEQPPDPIVEQTHTVFRELGITFERTERSEADRQWQLHGETQRGQPVKVTVRQLAPEVAKVWVRVGHLGDRELSVTVLQRIRERL